MSYWTEIPIWQRITGWLQHWKKEKEMGVIQDMMKVARTIGVGAKSVVSDKQTPLQKPAQSKTSALDSGKQELVDGEKALKGKTAKQSAINDLMKEK